MSRIDPDLVRSLYLAACERDPGARRAFLEHACSGDEELRSEVESLLEHDQELGSFLETPPLDQSQMRAAADALAGDLGPPSSSYEESGKLPERIGPYAIRGVLGEGGMGIVYLAEQENPRRTVALKVIRPGLASGARLRRFEHEAQILARLHHPGIAQIYAAGTADTGHGPQPYFAMELVEGRVLDKHVAAARPAFRARLEILAKICDAVQHAHQRGVIHRDLKSANIVVDGSGEPKILDFGVARVTGADFQPTTLRTAAGEILGTLAYMSPEQVHGQAEDVDTRSDIYALGAVLYELLAGRLPHDLCGKTIAEAARIVTEVEPKRLGALEPRCAGDLETIAAKALEKDRTRRYASASDLAADLRRYLSDEPIAARPPSTVYQLRKFARRNKGLVGGIAATFAVLVTGVVISTWQAVRAVEAGKLARLRLGQLQREADRARTAKEHVGRILAAAQVEEQGREATVRQALESSEKWLDKDFADQPAIAASLHRTHGETWFSLGETKRARMHLERALELFEEAGDPLDAEALEAEGDLVRVLRAEGELDAAQRHASGLLALADPGSRLALQTQAEGALIQIDLGHLEEGSTALRKSVEELRALGGPGNRDVLDYDSKYCDLLVKLGRWGEAEAAARSTLEEGRETFGPEDPTVLAAQRVLIQALLEENRGDEAELLSLEALALHEQVFGPDHRHLLSMLTLRTDALIRLQRFDEAEPLLVRAVETGERVYGPEHIETAAHAAKLAFLLDAAGKYEQALPQAQRAWEIQRQRRGEGSVEAVQAGLVVASLCTRSSRFKEAATAYRGLHAAAVRDLGRDNPTTLQVLANFGAHEMSVSHWSDAEKYLTECWQRSREVLGADDSRTLDALYSLAYLMEVTGRLDRAEECCRMQQEGRRRARGEDHWETWMSLFDYARVRLLRGPSAEVEQDLDRALEALRPAAPQVPAHVAMAFFRAGRLWKDRKDFERAEAYMFEACDIALRQLPAKSFERCFINRGLIDLAREWGRPDKVAQYEAIEKERAEEESR